MILYAFVRRVMNNIHIVNTACWLFKIKVFAYIQWTFTKTSPIFSFKRGEVGVEPGAPVLDPPLHYTFMICDLLDTRKSSVISLRQQMIFVWGPRTAVQIRFLKRTALNFGHRFVCRRGGCTLTGSHEVSDLSGSPTSAYFHFLSSVCPYIALVLTTLKQSQLVMICE